jgi:hypothetical protein
VYELFRGVITTEELDWSEKQIREFVASRKSANPHLSSAVGIAEGANDLPPRTISPNRALSFQAFTTISSLMECHELIFLWLLCQHDPP